MPPTAAATIDGAVSGDRPAGRPEQIAELELHLPASRDPALPEASSG